MLKKSELITGLIFFVFITGCGSQSNLIPTEITANPQTVSNNEDVSANGLFDKKVRKIILDVMAKYDHDKSGGIDYRANHSQERLPAASFIYPENGGQFYRKGAGTG